jgi:hypothetical protein
METAVVIDEASTKRKMSKKSEAQEMLQEAKTASLRFKKAWFDFARITSLIAEKETFRDLGYDSFRSFCLAEFSDFDHSMIVKFNRVYKSLGKQIEARLKKSEDLPTMDSCYMLVSKAKDLPKDKYAKLVKKVLANEITRNELRDVLNEKAEEEDEEFVDAEVVDDVEDEIEESIEEEEDNEEEDVSDSEVSAAAKRATSAATVFLDALEKCKIEEELNDHVYNLAVVLDEKDLITKVTMFLEKVEEVCE